MTLMDQVRDMFAKGLNRQEVIDQLRSATKLGTLYSTVSRVSRELGLPKVLDAAHGQHRSCFVGTKLTPIIFDQLSIEAKERHMSLPDLIEKILRMTVLDNLFDAILGDDE